MGYIDIFNKKKIPHSKQMIDPKDVKSVLNALQSDSLAQQGAIVAEFELKFANYVGAKYAVAVPSGSTGLHLAMTAIDLAPGQRVITTPITSVASAHCVRYGRGEVWFADIDPETYLLDINAVKRLLESKPKDFFTGIIAVDFAGLAINLEEFRALADEYGLWIIENACHAPGAYFIDSKGHKQLCGNGLFADAAIFSFSQLKHISCGEGGMITTNDPTLYKRLRRLRNHGLGSENKATTIDPNTGEVHGDWYYEIQELGFNYRLTDIQASLGLTQLTKNSRGLIRRNQMAELYKQAFSDKSLAGKIKYQNLPRADNNKYYYNAHYLFVIEVPDRNKLYNYLHQYGILAQVHYIPIHLSIYYQQFNHQGANYKHVNLNNTMHYYQHCLSLPIYPGLAEHEQQFIIEKVLSFFDL